MKVFVFAAAAALAATPAMAVDTIVYNSTPNVDWHFGTGNDYSPSNTAVLTTAQDDQLMLRFHETFERAPASDANGVYSFALGTDPISFDWGIDTARNITALITISNIGTGQSVSYDPLAVGNDNSVLGNSVQNSFRLNCFGFCPGLFTPNIGSTYQVNLTATANAGTRSLDVFAKIGSGVVPEPQTWAMLVLGFGVIGGAMRSRKRKLAFASAAA